jgi:hypothetical protein
LDLKLISKVNGSTKVLMTPAGVQIWVKGQRILGADEVCAICRKKIGKRPFFVPMAGIEIPAPTERVHGSCMNKLELLPMKINPLIEVEEGPIDGWV